MTAGRQTEEAGLRVEETGGLDRVSRAVWNDLFRSHPDPFESVALMHRCGMEGVKFRTIVVSDRHGPVMVLPTFETRFEASSMADGRLGAVLRRLAGLLPGLLRPRLLGVGLPECERGQVGRRPGVEAPTLDAAWRMGLRAVGRLAREVHAHAEVFLDLDPESLGSMPTDIRARFARADTPACARLPIRFASVEEYLSTLSRSTRQGLRRKARDAGGIRVERSTIAGADLPDMYALYLETVERSDIVLGVLSPGFFDLVGAETPGVQFVKYFAEGRMIAFNLLIEREGVLLDKYFCMSGELGRRYNLYFVSWLENIRRALELGFTVYHAGAGAEATKTSLGCEFVRNTTLFRHTSPAAHIVLTALAKAASRGRVGQTAPVQA